jgi:tryptophan 2-monooxygenase
MSHKAFTPPSCIDVIYDYLPLLNDKPLCTIPENKQGAEIGIIGGGAAGLLAAYELLKMGLKPTVYEATNRIGGRLYTKQFEHILDDIKPFAELGAMRIPKGSHIFLHYADKLKLKHGMSFPSPGTVDTLIHYRSKQYKWAANKPPPMPFKKIKTLWEGFLTPSVDKIHAAWQAGNMDLVKDLWQLMLDKYKDKSFYEVLKEMSPINDDEQIHLFGALGSGGGGFSPFFTLGFSELLRIAVNRHFDDLMIFPNGISEFIDKLYHCPVDVENQTGSLADHESVKLNSPAVMIDYSLETENPVIVHKDKRGNYHRKEFQAVIFTGSVSAAQLINITGKTPSGVDLVNNNIQNAIKNSSMLASSKTYILTKDKFWLNGKFPQCILTDDLPRATYFLDYPQTKRGVICMSYTWGLDALKLHAVDPEDRVVMFKRVFQEMSPSLNAQIVPLNGEVISIDWINRKYQNGTTSVFASGIDAEQRDLYFQFQVCLQESDKGFYLAGDTISWTPGWVEGALQTGINAVFAVAKRLGAKIPPGSPLEQDPYVYKY